MPFFEKGEFIRPGRDGSGAGRPDRRSRTRSYGEGISRDDWFTIAKGLGAFVLLAGLIWMVVVFREWIAIAIGFWVVSSLRSWLR
jgi:hypothetical protein